MEKTQQQQVVVLSTPPLVQPRVVKILSAIFARSYFRWIPAVPLAGKICVPRLEPKARGTSQNVSDGWSLGTRKSAHLSSRRCPAQEFVWQEGGWGRDAESGPLKSPCVSLNRSSVVICCPEDS